MRTPHPSKNRRGPQNIENELGDNSTILGCHIHLHMSRNATSTRGRHHRKFRDIFELAKE